MSIKFGKKLKELRIEKNFNQENLGKVFGATKAIISRWESGEFEPDFVTLEKLADFFEISIDSLLGKEN